jgi:cystathionine beta-lyase
MVRTADNPLEQLSLEQLRQRTSMKWRTHPADVLPLWVAEMDVLIAPPVHAALTEALARGDTGYPAGTAYAEALAGFARERWGWDGVAVERTAIVPDVMHGIVEVLHLITGPGDTVVVNCPVYPPFYAFLEHMGRSVREAPLGADGRLDLEALAEAFVGPPNGSRAAAYLLCSPHNPTGTVHTAEELAAVAALACEHGVRVVADEIHAPLVLPGATFVPYLSVPGAGSGLSVLSATKGWNLAGLKAALVVAGVDAAGDLARMPEVVSHGPSHLGVVAHAAALRSGGEWLDALLAGLHDNRRLLDELLAEHLPTVSWSPPAATYLAWLDCRRLGFDDEVDSQARGLVSSTAGPAGAFLEQSRVAVSAGLAFGTGGAGHVRLNFGTSQAVLTEAVRKMGAAGPGPRHG